MQVYINIEKVVILIQSYNDVMTCFVFEMSETRKKQESASLWTSHLYVLDRLCNTKKRGGVTTLSMIMSNVIIARASPTGC